MADFKAPTLHRAAELADNLRSEGFDVVGTVQFQDTPYIFIRKSEKAKLAEYCQQNDYRYAVMQDIGILG